MKAINKNGIRKYGCAFIAAGAASVICPTSAFAAESKGGIDAILPQMSEFIPMLIAFLILWFVLAKFGWPVFEGMLKKREDTIAERLEKSETAQIESERLLAEYKQQLEEAKAQASLIVADAKRTGESVQKEITAKAQQEATNMIEKANVAIEAQKKAAIAELKSTVADTSIAVAGRLIGSDLNDAEHRKIIERYVEEAGGFNAN